MVAHLNGDAGTVILHVLGRSGRDSVLDGVAAGLGKGQLVIVDRPLDDLVACLSRSGLGTIALDSALEGNLV